MTKGGQFIKKKGPEDYGCLVLYVIGFIVLMVIVGKGCA